MKDKYQGQERALEELAGQLKKEILKSNELEEAANSSLAQAHWERDNEVINCKKCEKEFSITRRKVSFFLILFREYFINIYVFICIASL